MKTVGTDLKRALAKVVAALQICIGVLLLVGTVYLTLTAYKTVRYESEQIAENLSAAGKALCRCGNLGPTISAPACRPDRTCKQANALARF